MAATESRAELRRRLAMVVEALLLTAIVLVPLVFAPPGAATSSTQVPKVTALRVIAGLIVVAWSVHWALAPSPRLGWRALLLRSLRGNGARRWMLWAVLAYGGSQVISTLASASWRISVWGRTQGADGYALYTIAAFLVVLAATAAFVRTRPQVGRMIGAVAVAGTAVGAYALLQRVGLDPWDFPVWFREASTLGNPIFAGQFLLVTSLVTVAGALAFGQGGEAFSRWLLIGGAAAAAVQLTALLLTLSRGPWVGWAAGAAVLLVVAWKGPGPWQARRAAGLLGVAAAGGLALMLAVSLVDSPGTTRSDLGHVSSRAASIFTAAAETGFSNRFDIWRGTAVVFVSHPWFAGESDKLTWLRPLVGYGPDLFRSVFPLRENPDLHLFAFAHNHYLHLLLEVGILGLAAFGTLMATALRLAWLLRRHPEPWVRWLALGIGSAIVGWLVAAVPGIPRISDLALVWALTGLLFALSPAGTGSAAAAPEAPAAIAGTRAERRRRRGSDAVPMARIALATAAVAAVSWLSWDKGVEYAVASYAGGDVIAALARNDLAAAAERADFAVAMAPDVPLYHLQRGAVAQAAADRAADDAERDRYLQRAHQAAMDALAADPLSVEAIERAASSSIALVQAGLTAFAPVAVDLIDRLAAHLPADYRVWELRAHATWVMGDVRLALGYVDEAIELAGRGAPGARSHLMKGFFLDELGSPDQAISFATAAIDRGLSDQADLAEAHRFLARLYQDQGDETRRDAHLETYRRLTGS